MAVQLGGVMRLDVSIVLYFLFDVLLDEMETIEDGTEGDEFVHIGGEGLEVRGERREFGVRRGFGKCCWVRCVIGVFQGFGKGFGLGFVEGGEVFVDVGLGEKGGVFPAVNDNVGTVFRIGGEPDFIGTISMEVVNGAI